MADATAFTWRDLSLVPNLGFVDVGAKVNFKKIAPIRAWTQWPLGSQASVLVTEVPQLPVVASYHIDAVAGTGHLLMYFSLTANPQPYYHHVGNMVVIFLCISLSHYLSNYVIISIAIC